MATSDFTLEQCSDIREPESTTPSIMNNNASSQEARVSNGPGVTEENKGITCAERTSLEARSSHALSKVSWFKILECESSARQIKKSVTISQGLGMVQVTN